MFQWYFQYLPKDEESLNMTRKSVERLSEIHRRLTDFETIMTIQRFPISLENLFQTRVKEEVEILFRNINMTFTCEIEKNLWAHLDDYKVSRMIVYLLENATRQLEQGKGKCDLSIYQEEEKLVIKIENNLKGCKKEEPDKTCNSYYLRKAMLNSYYCNYVVEEHSGEINIVKNDQEGASYIIRISECLIDARVAAMISEVKHR